MVAKHEDLLAREDEFPAADWPAYCQAIATLHIPRFAEIPDFDLYMDQLIGYVGKQVGLFSVPTEKILTASMVNNYVKMRLVPQPKAKRYEPLHVAYLIVVCLLKRLYTMADIERIISLDVQHRFQAAAAYDKFIDVFEESLRTMFCGAPSTNEAGGMGIVAQKGAVGLVLSDPESVSAIDRDYVLLATSTAAKVFIEQTLVSVTFREAHAKADEERAEQEKKQEEKEEAKREEKAAKLARSEKSTKAPKTAKAVKAAKAAQTAKAAKPSTVR